MINKKDRNTANSAEKIFGIFQNLCEKDVPREDFLAVFSAENLNIYLNTLKKCGFIINNPKKGQKSYSLETSFNFLNINDNDIKILSKIKEIMAKKSLMDEIAEYNIFLENLVKITDNSHAEAIKNIIKKAPFDTKMHEKIKQIKKAIKEQKKVLITYNAPISKRNFFEVFPNNLSVENEKVYLSCYDYNLKETRYLKAERIENIKYISKDDEKYNENNFAICRFTNINSEKEEKDLKIEVIDKKGNTILAKAYFDNDFDFIQKILGYGDSCEIIEPVKIKEKIKKSLDLIRRNYV